MINDPLIVRGRRKRITNLDDDPFTLCIDEEGRKLYVKLEYGTIIPAVQHRLTLSDETNILYELRFYCDDPLSLVEAVVESIVNDVVPLDGLHRFVFQYGGSCLDFPDLHAPTPPRSILN